MQVPGIPLLITISVLLASLLAAEYLSGQAFSLGSSQKCSLCLRRAVALPNPDRQDLGRETSPSDPLQRQSQVCILRLV